jgi:hypothetical protein
LRDDRGQNVRKTRDLTKGKKGLGRKRGEASKIRIDLKKMKSSVGSRRAVGRRGNFMQPPPPRKREKGKSVRQVSPGL